jgi:hypothetical protein
MSSKRIYISGESMYDGYGMLIFRYFDKKIEKNGKNGKTIFFIKDGFDSCSDKEIGKIIRMAIKKFE